MKLTLSNKYIRSTCFNENMLFSVFIKCYDQGVSPFTLLLNMKFTERNIYIHENMQFSVFIFLYTTFIVCTVAPSNQSRPRCISLDFTLKFSHKIIFLFLHFQSLNWKQQITSVGRFAMYSIRVIVQYILILFK